MDNRNIMKHIKENWIIYAFVVQLITTFVLNSADHVAFEKRLITLEQKQDTEEVTLTEIKSRLASIDTSLKFLTKRYEEQN